MSKSKTFSTAVAAVLLSVAAASLATTPANAAVVCKTAGVPQGCVVAPTAAPVVVAPAAPVAAASVTRVGYYGRYYGGPVAVKHVGYTRVWR